MEKMFTLKFEAFCKNKIDLKLRDCHEYQLSLRDSEYLKALQALESDYFYGDDGHGVVLFHHLFAGSSEKYQTRKISEYNQKIEQLKKKSSSRFSKHFGQEKRAEQIAYLQEKVKFHKEKLAIAQEYSNLARERKSFVKSVSPNAEALPFWFNFHNEAFMKIVEEVYEENKNCDLFKGAKERLLACNDEELKSAHYSRNEAVRTFETYFIRKEVETIKDNPKAESRKTKTSEKI